MHPRLIALENSFQPSILSRVNDPMLSRYNIELWLKRDDLLHPVISGNKWRKLKYSLNHVLTSGRDTVISMGGAYSNYLHALAFSGQIIGLKTIGLIRGERPNRLSPTLEDCQRWGMQLRYFTRSDYRRLRQYRDNDQLPELKPNEYWLGEGGSHPLALKGIAEMIEEIDMPFDVLCLPCGTGTTLAGCLTAVSASCRIIGIAALKGAEFLTAEIEKLLPRRYTNWHIQQNYHFGGFARTSTELLEFIRRFESTTEIPLEPVYTGKMMYALYDLIAKNAFGAGTRIIAVHTGGLQGKRGFDDRQSMHSS